MRLFWLGVGFAGVMLGCDKLGTNGGDAPDGGGPPGTVSTARRQAIFSQFEGELDAYLAADRAGAIDRIASDLRAVPEIADVVETPAARSVTATFVDGTTWVLGDPTDGNDDVVTTAESERRVEDQPPPDVLPGGAKYVFLETLDPAHGWADLSDLRTTLEQAGYTRLDIPFTTVGLHGIDFSQVGVLIFHTHGVIKQQKDGNFVHAIWTGDQVDVDPGELTAAGVFAVTMPTIASATNPASETHWAIGSDFIMESMTPSPPPAVPFNTLIYAQACLTAGDQTLAGAFFGAGVGTYLGWDGTASDGLAYEVARKLFIRLLGPLASGAVVPGDTPPVRPVDVDWVFDEFPNSLQYTTMPSDPAAIRELRHYNAIELNSRALIRPSIVAMDFSPTDGSLLHIRGDFGAVEPNQQLTVTVGGRAHGGVVTNPAGGACTAAGACPSQVDIVLVDDDAGDVVVTVGGLKSEAIPLTSWHEHIATTVVLQSPCTVTYTWDLHLRADIRRFRVRPAVSGVAPTILPSPAVIPAAPDSTLGWVVGGESNTVDGHVVCSGQGSAALDLDSPHIAGPYFSVAPMFQDSPAQSILPRFDTALADVGNLPAGTRTSGTTSTDVPLSLAPWADSSALHLVLTFDNMWDIKGGTSTESSSAITTIWMEGQPEHPPGLATPE